MPTWNLGYEQLPTSGETPSYGDDRIRELKVAVRERFAKEHNMDLSTGTLANHGHHKMGSAVSYYQAAEPTVRPDGVTALTAADAGRIWIRSTDARVHIYTGTAWVALTAITTADNTFTGANVFSGSITIPTPTNNYHASTKKYVDDSLAAVAITTNTTTATIASTTYAAGSRTLKAAAIPAAVQAARFFWATCQATGGSPERFVVTIASISATTVSVAVQNVSASSYATGVVVNFYYIP